MQNLIIILSVMVYLVIIVGSLDLKRTMSRFFPWKTCIFSGIVGICAWGYHYMVIARHTDLGNEVPFITWMGFLFSLFLAWSFFEMRKYSQEWRKEREKDEENVLFLRTIIENSPMYIGRLDAQGRITSFDSKMLAGKGYKLSDFKDKSVFSLFRDNKILIDFFERALKGEQVSGEVPGYNGIYELILKPIINADGKVDGALGFGTEITSRKKIERELRETLTQYKALTDSAHDFIFMVDREFKVIFLNIYGARIFRKSPDDIIGKPMQSLFPPEDSGRMAANLQEIFQTGEAKYIESKIGFPPGERWLDTRLIPMKNEKQEIYAVLGVSRDISDRKFSEEARRKSEDKYRMLMEKAGEAIFLYDQTGVILDVNQRATEISGYSREELVGVHPSQFVPEECRAAALNEFTRIFDSKSILFELTQARKDGALRQLEFTGTLLPDNNILGFVRDITEKRKEEELMRFTSFSMDNILESIYWVGPDGRFVHVNDAACRGLGYSREELLMKCIGDVDSTISMDTWAERWERNKSVGGTTLESVHRTKGGREFPVEIRISYMQFLGKEYLCGFSRDISEKKQFEEERLRAQKLESVGVLAGGIAHDFNNILTIILGNISLARKIFESGGSVIPKLTEAEKGAMRARDLTRQLLTFSQAGAPVKKAASIAELVRESAGFVLRGSLINPEFLIPEYLWPAEIDESQISRVISNIVINAQQAMPGGGRITITAENIDLQKVRGMPLISGQYVRIAIKDEGVGIPQEILPRVFEPYFTTKSAGSGLGLAISYSIVRRHNGHISVESEINRGTTFFIYLPATKKAVEKKIAEPDGGFKGQGSILVMDDEEAIRVMAGSALNQLGFEVDFAGNGLEAIEKYKIRLESGKPYSAVIMDLTIPGGLGGKDTMERLKALHPSVKGIVSSGYSIDPVMADFEKFGFVNVIAKPYRVEDLKKCLEEVLSDFPRTDRLV